LNCGENSIPPVVTEVLSYFMRNPQAADNLEGIARWRLLNEVIRRKIDETRVALAWLVEHGFLCESESIGADPIFTLNPKRIEEAQEFLNSPATCKSGCKKN
jgi:hypothetical protein